MVQDLGSLLHPQTPPFVSLFMGLMQALPLAVSEESGGGVGALSTVPTVPVTSLLLSPSFFLCSPPYQGNSEMLQGRVWRADIFLRVPLKLRVPWVPSLLSYTTLLAVEAGPGQALVGVAVGQRGSQ